MLRLFEFIASQFIEFSSNISDLIEIFIRLPRTLLGGQSESSFVGRILLLLVQVIWFPIYAIGWLMLVPLRLLTDFSVERRHDFMCGLPAIFVFGFIAFVLIYVNVQADNIEREYRSKGQELMLAKNYDAAKTYYGRIISDKSSQRESFDIFNWAIILGRTGEPLRAMAILDKLAPFEKVGYHLAHRMKAINIAQSLQQSKDPLVLRKLRWHLEHSRGEYVFAINRAWSIYYLAVDQPEKALPYLEEAASENPTDLIDIARIHGQLGNQAAQLRTIATAEARFREMVENDPLDSRNRIILANALVQLKKIDEAEQVLQAGIHLQADPIILRSTADFYVMRHDLARKNNASFTEQFEFLRQAMALDVNYPVIYERLLKFYNDDLDAEELAEIKAAVMKSVTSDEPSALAHFTLSNVLWIEGDSEQAEWHLEQAYQLDPNFVVVLNNLAWTLVNKTDPDLDRAFELAKKVIEQMPDDARYRDTYATVLMKQEKFQEAVLEFERALSTIANKKPLHEKLAYAYQRLGQNELAAMHAKQASNSQ